MSRVRCHFDGKVFVPEESVDAPAGTAGEVIYTLDETSPMNGKGGTMADLLVADASGWIEELRDLDTPEFAEELRRRCNWPNYDKQRAFIDLHEYWDSVGVARSDEDGTEGEL